MRCTLVMPGLARLIREPGTSSPFQYARRVYQLAAAFVALFLLSLLGIALLVWKARLFVSLTQRSNVETLTLAFFALFFTYLGLLSAPGLAGALRIAYYDGLIRRLGRERLAVERLKAEALGPPRAEPPFIAINRIIEHADRPGERLEIAVGRALPVVLRRHTLLPVRSRRGATSAGAVERAAPGDRLRLAEAEPPSRSVHRARVGPRRHGAARDRRWSSA